MAKLSWKRRFYNLKRHYNRSDYCSSFVNMTQGFWPEGSKCVCKLEEGEPKRITTKHVRPFKPLIGQMCDGSKKLITVKRSISGQDQAQLYRQNAKCTLRKHLEELLCKEDVLPSDSEQNRGANAEHVQWHAKRHKHVKPKKCSMIC